MRNGRIRYERLQDRLVEPEEAAAHIQDGMNLFISGFTAGYPKMIPQQLAERARRGERFKVNLYAGASTGDSVDGILAQAGVVNWRRPYMSDRAMRERINRGEILFKDDHLSRLSAQVRAGDWGRVDVAVVEAVAITEKGHLVPSMSVGNTPTYVKMADKIIIGDVQCRASGARGHSRHLHPGGPPVPHAHSHLPDRGSHRKTLH